jgi:hypothetical protein
MPWKRVIEGYYLATPLFFAIDLVWREPVRAAALSAPGGRYAYYVVLVLLGLLCRVRPAWAPAIGMGESAFNLLLLILSVMLPIWNLTDQVLTDQPITGGLTQAHVWNFALAGTMAVLSFKRSEWAMRARPRV